MSIRLTTLRQHRWLISLLVVALALRALIPVGFMPSGDGKVALQICPEGFPAALLHSAGHHHHGGDSSQGAEHGHHGEDHSSPGHDHKSWMQGHCPFGAAAGAPVLCNLLLVALTDLQSAVPFPDTVIVAAALDFRFLIAQPRGPPTYLV